MLSYIIDSTLGKWTQKNARTLLASLVTLSSFAFTHVVAFADGAQNVIDGAGGTKGGTMNAAQFGASFNWIVGLLQSIGGFIMVMVFVGLFIKMGWGALFGDSRSQGAVFQGFIFVAIAIFGIIEAPLLVTYIASNTHITGAALMPTIGQLLG